jgi:hypothetical protein
MFTNFLRHLHLAQDLAGCANFILLALLSLALGADGELPATRAWVATALVCASRAELGSYLLYRVSVCSPHPRRCQEVSGLQVHAPLSHSLSAPPIFL